MSSTPPLPHQYCPKCMNETLNKKKEGDQSKFYECYSCGFSFEEFFTSPS